MKDFNDLLFELSLNNLNAANKKHSDIDLKALSIISICGILIGLMIGDSFSKFHDEMHPNNFVLKIIFATCVCLLIITIIVCTKVIHPRKTKSVSTFLITESLANENEERQIGMAISTIATNEEELQELCNSKANQLWIAIKFFSGGIFFIAIYAFFIFFIY